MTSRRLRTAPSNYRKVRDEIDGWLGYPTERWPIIIGIDGADGIGKSTFASWLGWQLGIAVVNLDLFLVPNTGVIQWRAGELRNVINTRIARRCPKPVIVEGVLLLKALEEIEVSPDRLIWLTNDGGGDGLAEQRRDYGMQFEPARKADLAFQLTFDDD